MRHETLMAAAMRHAGVDVDGARLHAAAVSALRDNRTEVGAAASLVGDLRADPALLLALARRYLSEIAADMRGESIREQSRGGRHRSSEAQRISAPTNSYGDDTGQALVDPRSTSAPSPYPDRDGAGQHGLEPQASGFREPSAAQRAAVAAVAHASAKTVLDTFRVRDGRAVGDLKMAEVRRLARENGIERHVLVAIAGRYANASSGDFVRDIIKPSDLERFICEAREAEDAT